LCRKGHKVAFGTSLAGVRNRMKAGDEKAEKASREVIAGYTFFAQGKNVGVPGGRSGGVGSGKRGGGGGGLADF